MTYNRLIFTHLYDYGIDGCAMSRCCSSGHYLNINLNSFGRELQMSGFRINLKPLPSALPVPEEEEYYSSWSLFLVCVLLVLSLWTSYYLQIKKIKTIHETLVSIFAGMVVGLIVRLAPGTMIRDMLVSVWSFFIRLRAAWFSALRFTSWTGTRVQGCSQRRPNF